MTATRNSLYLRILVKVLEETPRRLLDEHEKLFIQQFLALDGNFPKLMIESTQVLYVRLFFRNFAWITLSDLEAKKYVLDTKRSLDSLVSCGLLLDGNELTDLETALNLLNDEQRKAMALTYKLNKSYTKEKLLDALLKHSRTQKAFFTTKNTAQIMLERAKKSIGDVYKVDVHKAALFHRFQLAYFCFQEWTPDAAKEDLLSEINRRVYPEYKVGDSIFKDRQHFLDYELALKAEYQLAQFSEAASKVKDADGKLKVFKEAWSVAELRVDEAKRIISATAQGIVEESFELRFLPAYVWTRYLSFYCTILGKLQRYEEEYKLLEFLLSQPFFCTSRRGSWWCRLMLLAEWRLKEPVIIDLENEKPLKQQLLEHAIDLGKQAQGDPKINAARRRDIEKRVMRVVTKLENLKVGKSKKKRKRGESDESIQTNEDVSEDTILVEPPPIQTNVIFAEKSAGQSGRKALYLLNDELPPCSVEEKVLVNYVAKGWKGLHAEGAIFTSLFALLFWDIIFLPVPCVFVHSFQAGPLDIGTEYFYRYRKQQIDTRLEAILNSSEVALDILVLTYQKQFERQPICVGMNWNIALSDIVEITDCIQSVPGRLHSLMRILALDFRRSSGIPDLTLWDPVKRDIKMVEVKGPGDSLAMHQLIWQEELNRIGIHAEVCRVEEIA